MDEAALDYPKWESFHLMYQEAKRHYEALMEEWIALQEV